MERLELNLTKGSWEPTGERFDRAIRLETSAGTFEIRDDGSGRIDINHVSRNAEALAIMPVASNTIRIWPTEWK